MARTARLGEYEIGGLTTLLPFHQAQTRHQAVGQRCACRDLTDDPEWPKTLAPKKAPAPARGRRTVQRRQG